MQNLFDGHVHIGQFNSRYFRPEVIAQTLLEIGVTRWVFSSTSSVTLGWGAQVKDVRAHLKVAWRESLPLLWVTKALLNSSSCLAQLEELPFIGIKLHGYLEPWNPHGKPIYRVFEVAAQHRLPILLHTGGCSRSNAGRYLQVCRDFPSVRVILAHGRPIIGALRVLATCPNTYVDTAFMPAADVCRVVRHHGAERVIFGSDLPIHKHFFPKQSIAQSWEIDVAALKAALSPAEWSIISTVTGARVYA